MRVERLVSFLLLGIALILVIAAFNNPLDQIDFIKEDIYFKDAHRDALCIYAAFIAVPALMMLLWVDKNNPIISKLCWATLAAAIVIAVTIIYLTYFINPYDVGFDDYYTYSWYVAYALIALIILTIIYLVAKLFRVGKE